MSMKHLRAVVTLARFGSFIAAASYLRISQPGLSRIIQQAEGRLGAKLFVRGTRSVSQTEAGREFTPAAERLLGELLQQSQKVRELDGQMRGQLIISSLMSISHRVLPAALVTFRKKHPKMHVQIREGLTSAVHEDVRSGVADFGIGNAMDLAEGVVAESIVHEACYVVTPKRHRLGALSFASFKDIGDEPMISMPSDSGLRRTLDVAPVIVASYSTTVSSPTNSVRYLISYRAALASPLFLLRLFPRRMNLQLQSGLCGPQ